MEKYEEINDFIVSQYCRFLSIAYFDTLRLTNICDCTSTSTIDNCLEIDNKTQQVGRVD